MKKFFIFLTVAVCGAGLDLRAQNINGVKAVVHDSVVTFHEVESMTAGAVEILRRQLRGQNEVYQQRVNEALNDNLEQLVNRQLILQEFASAGYNIPESIIDEEVQNRIRRDFGDRASLAKSLQAQGRTFEKFRQQERERIIITALRSKNIAAEIMVSPQKIENYYKEHQDTYKVGDQVKLRMIVLNKPTGGDVARVKQLATEVLAKVKEGASFSEMASIHSDGSQRQQGGDWGWVERSVLRKELADVAFTINPGVPSDIVETPEALYLMLVEEKKMAHIKPLTEVRDEIEQTLLAQERTRLENQWLSRLRKKTFVQYY